MTAPGFGQNAVGSAVAPCPLGNLNFKVTQRTDGAAPTCDVRLTIFGPQPEEGRLAGGAKQGGFLKIPPGKYTVAIIADSPLIDRYEVPNNQMAEVPKGGSVTVEFLLDPFVDIIVTVASADNRPIGGDVEARLERADGTRTLPTKNGRTTFDKVRVGPYQASVVLPADLAKRFRAPDAVTVNVAAGTKPPPVDIKLIPLPWIELAVTAEGPKKVTGFAVKLKGSKGTPAIGRSPDGAKVKVEGLEPGSTTCTVEELVLEGDEVFEFVKRS